MDGDTYWDQHLVLRDTFIFHPFTQTTEGNTSRLANTSVGITKASFYYGPYVFHDGCHVFTATFDRYTEGEHSTTTDVCIWGLEVLLNHGPERGEDLSRGEGCGQIVNYSQSRLGSASEMEGSTKSAAAHTTGCVFVGVFRFRLSSDGHKPLQDRRGEALALNLRLLTAMGRG